MVYTSFLPSCPSSDLKEIGTGKSQSFGRSERCGGEEASLDL
jgi:hypothetical protein